MPRYELRKTNFAPGPRYNVLDRETDRIVRSFTDEAEAERFFGSFMETLADLHLVPTRCT